MEITAQPPAQEISNQLAEVRPIMVSAGTIAVVILILISVGLRLAALGSVPLTETETRQALSAYRSTTPEASGNAITSDSPILFVVQRIAFGLVGGSEVTARILTALAGAVLTCLPLLFSDLIGRARAFLFAVLLTFSPVMIAASRLSSGTVWAMVFATIGLWVIWRYYERRGDSQPATAYGVTAFMAFAALIFLSEPGGLVLALIITGAGAAALILTVLDAPDDANPVGDNLLAGIRTQFSGFPWQAGAIGAVLLVLIVSTGFMLSPQGLSTVGATLSGFFTGITESTPGHPLFFPLVNSLFYEPWLWIFALGAVWLLVRREALDFTNRFFIFWLIFAGFASILYQGAGAAHALWLVVPLAGLATYLLSDALLEDDTSPLWIDTLLDREEERTESVIWSKWLLAFLMCGLLVMMGLHLQIVARGILKVGDGNLRSFFTLIGQGQFQFEMQSLIWLVMTLLFMGVGYMLAASIWGNRIPLQSAVLGTFAFALITGTSAGWDVSVTNASDPVELWHIETATSDAALLRQTMIELSDRGARGFPLLPVAVLAPSDGIIAWELRDFPNTTYIQTVEEGRTLPIVLLPDSLTEPDLGGAYVGQKFTLTHVWSGNLPGFDALPWWVMRRVRPPLFSPSQVYILWVRQDVFDGQQIGQ